MESWNQTSTDSVRTHTPDGVNRRIDARVEKCVQSMAEHMDRSEISRYLEKLEKEWDLNRVVTVAASAGFLTGLGTAGISLGIVLTLLAGSLDGGSPVPPVITFGFDEGQDIALAHARAHGTDSAPGMWPPRRVPSCG